MATDTDTDTDHENEPEGDESTAEPNYTDRHPEHFRNPPGHVREFREGETADEDESEAGA